MTKICNICGVEKPIDEYYIVKNKYRCYCCKSCYSKKTAQTNREARAKDGNKKHNEWSKKHYHKKKTDPDAYINREKDKIKEYKKKWYEENKERLRKEAKKRYLKIPREKLNKQARENRTKNLDKYRKREREYVRERRLKDKQFRLLCNLRSRVRCAVKNKSNSTLYLLGCTIDQFVIHIESQFNPDMNWDNYGKYWEIDHIQPCCSFDLEDEDQQKVCFHWSNCRPLSGADNRSKIAQDMAQHRRNQVANQEAGGES